MKRYIRNKEMISDQDQEKLKETKICVIGCGGLGGYIIEMAARLGIGEITLVDGDVFEASNLNRQLFSNMENLGTSKVLQVAKAIKAINPEVLINPLATFVDKDNCKTIIGGHHYVIDGTDDIGTRKMLVKTCSQLGIPFIFGAIAGWYGMVSTIFPNEDTLDRIYKTKATKGEEVKLGNPSFTPGLVASIQVSELIKMVTGKGHIAHNGFLYIDLLANEIEFLISLNQWMIN